MVIAGQKEPLFSWRRISFFLIAILIIVFLVNAIPSGTREIWGSTKDDNPDTVSSRFGDPTADNENIDGLTSAQCAAAFPDLYSEIDRSVIYWKKRGHVIGAKDIQIRPNEAAMRILIHNNEMRILESYHSVDPRGSSPDRATGVLYLIQRALDSAIAAGDELPTVEIALNFQDDPHLEDFESDSQSFWTFARKLSDNSHQRLWLMPNFDFWYYIPTGAFADAKQKAMQYDASFTGKIPQIVWRGNSHFGAEVRDALLNATADQTWADVIHVGEHTEPAAMRVNDFCKYAMTVYTEGVTYSGRLKFLMNCKSLLFFHDLAYATHYSHLLEKEGPKQNSVGVARDFHDLESKVQYYLENPNEADKIITRFLETFRSRYTTRAANSCYIRHLIHGYGSVAFKPNVYVDDGEISSPRGFSFQQFIETPMDTDLEHYNGSILRRYAH